MAICKNCGAQIPDGSSFCENCGATQVGNNQASNRPVWTGKKKISAKWIGIAAAVVVAIIAIVMISNYVQHVSGK